MDFTVIGEMIAKVVAVYAIVARLIEAVLQWWNTTENKNAVMALWKILYNFVTVELYKPPAK